MSPLREIINTYASRRRRASAITLAPAAIRPHAGATRAGWQLAEGYAEATRRHTPSVMRSFAYFVA